MKNAEEFLKEKGLSVTDRTISWDQGDKAMSLIDLMEEYKQSEVSQFPSDEILKLIPTNWLDPLLTGKDKVVGEAPYGCPDIEALLNAIKERQAKWMREQSSKEEVCCHCKKPFEYGQVLEITEDNKKFIHEVCTDEYYLNIMNKGLKDCEHKSWHIVIKDRTAKDRCVDCNKTWGELLNEKKDIEETVGTITLNKETMELDIEYDIKEKEEKKSKKRGGCKQPH